MGIAVKCATWKSLLNNMYLDSATRDLKGEDEANNWKNPGIRLFFYPETKAFAQDPCFMVIALPSTGMDGPALTLMVDKVWGDDKLVHLSGLPVTDMGDDPLSPICDTVGSECISGLYPIPI
jgi:hypothetical protein